MLKEIYVWKTLGHDVRKYTQLKFHKTMELSRLMYASETWTFRRRDHRGLATAEMRLLQFAAGYAVWDNEK
jgi:hypothetical protein